MTGLCMCFYSTTSSMVTYVVGAGKRLLLLFDKMAAPMSCPGNCPRCFESRIQACPHFTVHLFIMLCRYHIFYKLKISGHFAASKSVGIIFPKAFVHFTSLCYILIILAISLFHYYSICYGDLQSGITAH